MYITQELLRYWCACCCCLQLQELMYSNGQLSHDAHLGKLLSSSLQKKQQGHPKHPRRLCCTGSVLTMCMRASPLSDPHLVSTLKLERASAALAACRSPCVRAPSCCSRLATALAKRCSPQMLDDRMMYLGGCFCSRHHKSEVRGWR